jgi:hypothetical protein
LMCPDILRADYQLAEKVGSTATLGCALIAR